VSNGRRAPKAPPENGAQGAEPATVQRIRIGTLNTVKASQTYTKNKGRVITQVSITVTCPPQTAEVVMQLATQGVPLYAEVGTDQTTMFPVAADGEDDAQLEPQEPEEE